MLMDEYLLSFVAIKGKVRSIDEKDQWLYIKIEVKKIIKEGKRKLVKNKRFQFVKKAACDCPKITADTVDADFLIMGKDQGIQGDKIVMDNEVFVKAWPSSGTGARFFKKFRRKIAKKDACS